MIIIIVIIKTRDLYLPTCNISISVINSFVTSRSFRFLVIISADNEASSKQVTTYITTALNCVRITNLE